MVMQSSLKTTTGSSDFSPEEGDINKRITSAGYVCLTGTGA